MSGKRNRSVLQRLTDMSVPEPNSGCLLWVGSLDGKGYGQLMIKPHGGPRRAHRLMYEETKGPIPAGLDLDHLCRVRSCINPDHLEPVTRKENLRRGAGFNAHCPCGRDYSLSPSGRRWCLPCIARVRRERKARRVA